MSTFPTPSVPSPAVPEPIASSPFVMTNLIALQASAFAREKHKEQKRKYTGEPYFNHLEEVAELTRVFGLGLVAEVVAYLHDTVEDTNTTHAELVEKFGVEIAMGVRALTKPPLDAGNRKVRKEMDRVRLSQAPAVIQSIKCCDLISNCRDIIPYDPDFALVFLDEMDELLKALHLANKDVHSMAYMMNQTFQLVAFLDKVKKDKTNVPHTGTQTDSQPDTAAQTGPAA